MSGDSGDDIERVRAATDLVAVVSRYVQLKRTGRNFKACCPFHDEKTPSFNVNAEKQFFKCFGCGAGGTVFDFLMRVERLTFAEALRNLAKDAGIELSRERSDGKNQKARDQLARVMDWAARFFRNSLLRPEGEGCRAYVAKRGISEEESARFGLGFARPGWRHLLEAAAAKGVPQDLLFAGGLAIRNQEGHTYDAFRNRLMFPIRNAPGHVIAFGGRALDGTEPKYLNSPESDTFRKRHTVYGLEHLGGLKAGEPVLIMEGYTDVIMATQWGVRGAVATLGTSLTPEQVRLLRRYADRAILVYDGDRAGSEASIRAIPLILGGGLDLKVVVLPSGEDPCDFFLRRREAGAQDLLAHTRELADFMVEKSVARFDLKSVDGKRRAAAFFADLLAVVDDPVVRDATVKRAAASIDVPPPTIERLVEERRARGRAPALTPRVDPAAHAATDEPASESRPRSRARRKAIRDLLDVCLNQPGLIEQRHVDRLPLLLDAESASSREIILGVLNRAWIAPEADPVTIMSVVEDDGFRQLLGTLLRDPEQPRDLRPQLEGALRYLENEALDREIHTLADTVMLTGSDDALRRLSEARLRAEDLRRGTRGAAQEGGAA